MKPIIISSRPTVPAAPAVFRYVFTVFAVLLAGGCASTPALVSTSYPTGSIESGIVYSLPKQLVSVQVVRSRVEYDKLVTKAQTAQAAHAEAVKTLATSKALAATLEEQVKQAPADDTAVVQELKKRLGIAQTEVRVSELNEAKAKVLMESARTELKTYPPESMIDTVTLTLRDPVPDPEHTYIAASQHSVWRTDTVAITTSGSGLLQGYVGTAADQKGTVVLQAIEAVGAAFKLGAAIAKMRSWEPEKEQGELKPFKYERLIDPTDDMEVSAVNADIAKLGSSLRLHLSGPSERKTESAPLQAGVKINGFLYRRPQAYDLKVYDVSETMNSCDPTTGKYVQSLPMLLPNRSPLAYVELPAANFVTTDYDFAFKDGMLLSYKIKRPSEALAIASLVPDALNAIVAIPAEIVQLKIDYSSKEQELADAQKGEFEAKAALAALKSPGTGAAVADDSVATDTP